jgi:hypothetical protein
LILHTNDLSGSLPESIGQAQSLGIFF